MMIAQIVLTVLLAKAELVESYKPTKGCYVVNLLGKDSASELLSTNPELASRVTYRWSNGFAVASIADEAWFFNQVLYDARTISVERCGKLLVSNVLALPDTTNYRAIDRVDQRSRTPDGLVRRTAGGANSTIYLIDSGLTLTQQRLPLVHNAYPAAGPFSDDGFGHGSAMFEMIQGSTFGLATNATVFNFKAFSNNLGTGSTVADVVAALRYLYDNRSANGGQFVPGIVNMSLGVRVTATSEFNSIQLVVNDLRAAGFVVVAAAGNENRAIVDSASGLKHVPAAVPGVVTVAGVSVSNLAIDQRWTDPLNTGCANAIGYCGSNFGPEVSLFAPATNQPTRAMNGDFVVTSGTSGATAYTSAVLATAREVRPSLTLAQSSDFVISLLNTSGVADARSVHNGMLMSDLGYVRSSDLLRFQTETRVCPGSTQTTSAVKSVTATLKAARSNSGAGAAVIIGSTVARYGGCPNVPGNGGPVDLVVEAFDPGSGALLWHRTFADPNGSNYSIADNVGAIVEWDAALPGLAVLASSGETSRFGVVNETIRAGDGLDTYVVVLDPQSGSTTRVIRSGGAGNDVVRAGATVGSGPDYDLLVVGTSDKSFDGASSSGGSDVFAYSVSGFDFRASIKPVVFAQPGAQRIGAVTVLGNTRTAILVGGSENPSSGCSTKSLDTMVMRLAVGQRVGSPHIPGSADLQLLATSTFESPTSIVPAIQLDDWADTIARTTASTVTFGATTRQFDCFGGAAGYIGTDSAQLIEFNFLTGQIVSSHSQGIYNIQWPVRAEVVRGNGEENIHLAANGSAWKFDMMGTLVFAESVPAGPVAMFTGGDFNGWFGDAQTTQSINVR